MDNTALEQMSVDWQSFNGSNLGKYKFQKELQEAIIHVTRKNEEYYARLTGVLKKRGNRILVNTISNKHNWFEEGGTIYPLPRDISDLTKELAIYETTDINYATVVEFYRSQQKDIKVEFADDVFASANKKASFLASDLDVNGLKASLFDYQKKGVSFLIKTLNQLNGAILADEMGLGKTIQIIAVLLSGKISSTGPALILCPTSLVENWSRELSKFAPSLTYLIHRGADRTGSPNTLVSKNIVITTYDTLINDFFIFQKNKWSYLICDEAQALKNPDSKRRSFVDRLTRSNTIPVTGTPMENSLLDLWSLTDLTVPALLGTRDDFEKVFDDSKESAESLRDILDPIILKRSVADVAGDLPERIDTDIPLKLPPELSRRYTEILDETLSEYGSSGPLVATSRLTVFCAHPDLNFIGSDSEDENQDFSREFHLLNLNTPKLDVTSRLLSEAFTRKQKVLVFALFNKCGSVIKAAGQFDEGVYWNSINGGTPQESRQSIIDEFSAFDGPGCLILNPKAAGAGLNITAATVVIHFTQNWNPAIEMQASARAFRRGQENPVRIYRLFYEDTVEEIMIERSLWKRELGNEAVPISARNEDDLKKVISVKPMSL